MDEGKEGIMFKDPHCRVKSFTVNPCVLSDRNWVKSYISTTKGHYLDRYEMKSVRVNERGEPDLVRYELVKDK